LCLFIVQLTFELHVGVSTALILQLIVAETKFLPCTQIRFL